MSGLTKPKQYSWKDSNLELFGSETEINIKKEAAESEQAWRDVGDEVGLRIWRIVKFHVEEWPKEDYGKFFNGDSYIVLHTYREAGGEELLFDAHFWIGQHSTQDEYATAAYKTVELDTFLDDRAIQHRELEGHESKLFKSYFPEIVVLKGGADTGFRHVEPATYPPRLLRFKGDRKSVDVREMQLTRRSLDHGDVFILDLGRLFYQWNGRDSNKDERFKAMEWLAKLRSERGGCPAEVLEDEQTKTRHEFYQSLPDEELDEDEDHVVPPTPEVMKEPEITLYRLSDSSGTLQFSKVKVGLLGYGDLDHSDVFIVDAGWEVFVWVGARASQTEKKNGFPYAHTYLQDGCNCRDPWTPVSVVREGLTNSAFVACFA